MKWSHIILFFVFIFLVTSLQLFKRYQTYLLNTKIISLRALQKEKMDLEIRKMNLAHPQHIYSQAEHFDLVKNSTNQVIVLSGVSSDFEDTQ